MHHKRKDLLYKWLTLIVTSVHWFNPVMVFIRREIGSSCELSCDEAVIKGMSLGQRMAYGNTLLTLSANVSIPSGTLATTLCEEKRQLKMRLKSIKSDHKRSVLGSVLSLVLALGLTGCGALLGTDAGNDGSVAIIIGGADGSEKVIVSQHLLEPDMMDFDGDGKADIVHVEYKPTKDGTVGYARVSVTLGSGRELYGMDFPGDWLEGEPVIADLSGDGKDDILLVLENRTSNYSASDVYVLYVDNDALSVRSYGGEFIKNDSISHAQPESFYTMDCIGASVLSENGKNKLRLRGLISSLENSAYYIDCSWNGHGWYIENMSIGQAYGEDKIIQKLGSAQDPGIIPVVTREGFNEGELIFVKKIPASQGFVWNGDPEKRELSANNEVKLSVHEIATIALRQLYDMTGFQPEKCYVFANWAGDQCLINFSLVEDGYDHESFFTANINGITGKVFQLILSWRQKGVEYSPLDPSIYAPDGYETKRPAELAQWFYEHSSYGDRRAVVSTEEHLSPKNTVDMVKLMLGNGDFYEVNMQEDVGLPYYFSGPYEAGFEH